MHVFEDRQGEPWELSITLAEVKRLKATGGVDLADVSPELIGRLIDDPEALGNVLWCLCSDQAQTRGLDEYAFFGRLAGQSLDAACQAFLEELADFFPPWRAAPLRRALERLTELEQRASQAAIRLLDSPELERQIEHQLESFGAPSTGLPESSASTPTRSRSGNSSGWPKPDSVPIGTGPPS